MFLITFLLEISFSCFRFLHSRVEHMYCGIYLVFMRLNVWFKPTYMYLSRSVSYVDIGHGQRCLINEPGPHHTYVLVILHLNRVFGGVDGVDGSFSCRIHLFYFVRSFFLFRSILILFIVMRNKLARKPHTNTHTKKC